MDLHVETTLEMKAFDSVCQCWNDAGEVENDDDDDDDGDVSF